jgi:hypothetical protein
MNNCSLSISASSSVPASAALMMENPLCPRAAAAVVVDGAALGPSFIVSSPEARGQLHRVRVGPLESAAEFDRVSGDLRALGLTEVRLVAEE